MNNYKIQFQDNDTYQFLENIKRDNRMILVIKIFLSHKFTKKIVITMIVLMNLYSN